MKGDAMANDQASLLVDLLGASGYYAQYQIIAFNVPIADAVNRLRLVPPNGEMVQTARDVEISFGD